MAAGLNHLKERCAGCDRQDVPMNKEHIFAKWLILRTGTDQTGIRWGQKKEVPALAATFPLCEDCNSVFGRELEGPTSRLFDEVEAGRGVSDDDAELLIRCMWKIKGLSWIANHPGGRYTTKYTLRERVLLPIDDIRGRLILGLALVSALHPDSKDLPMGIDSVTEHDAIFVSGVFSRIAVMVVLAEFEPMVPPQFGRYRLASRCHPTHAAKLFHPPSSFRDDVAAVGVTWTASMALSRAHDKFALRLQSTAD